MKITRLFILILGLLALAGCDLRAGQQATAGRIAGSGTVSTETRDVRGFTSVALMSTGDLTVELGEREALVIEAEDNPLPYITADVKGRQLVIGTRPNISITPTKPIHYSLSVKQLDGVDLSGSGNVTLQKLQADLMNLNISGSGSIFATGAVEQLKVNLPGSGMIEGANLRATSAQVSIPGSGTTVVWATERLDVTIPGSGTVRYYGAPSVSQNIPGSGQVIRLGDK